MRDRVFVSFYDRGNLGDDLLFRVLVDRYPQVRFDYLEMGAGNGAFAHAPHADGWSIVRYADGVLRRLRVPWRVERWARRRLIRRSRFAVRIGGSLYMERGAWRLDADLDEELLTSREGAFFVNGNFGPWRSEEFLARYAGVFSRAVDVTVRDRASREQLSGTPTVRLAPDLIFSIARPTLPAEPAGVVISVIDLSHREDLAAQQEPYEAAVASLAEALLDAGEQVTLMSFCTYEGDEAAADRILDRLGAGARGRVGTHYYRGDVDAALATIAGARTVVATRFHAMVLGLAFGCRVCSIAYSDKTVQALDDLGLDRHGWSLEEFSATPVPELVRNVGEAGTALPEGVGRAAEEHFRVLDILLAETKEQR